MRYFNKRTLGIVLALLVIFSAVSFAAEDHNVMLTTSRRNTISCLLPLRLKLRDGLKMQAAL